MVGHIAFEFEKILKKEKRTFRELLNEIKIVLKDKPKSIIFVVVIIMGIEVVAIVNSVFMKNDVLSVALFFTVIVCIIGFLAILNIVKKEEILERRYERICSDSKILKDLLKYKYEIQTKESYELLYQNIKAYNNKAINWQSLSTLVAIIIPILCAVISIMSDILIELNQKILLLGIVAFIGVITIPATLLYVSFKLDSKKMYIMRRIEDALLKLCVENSNNNTCGNKISVSGKLFNKRVNNRT